MTSSEKIEYAKKHYPAGTKFISLDSNNNEVYTSIGKNITVGAAGSVFINVEGPNFQRVFSWSRERWAEIIKPEVINNYDEY